MAQTDTTGVWKGNEHRPSYPTFLLHVATAAVAAVGNIVGMGYPELIENPPKLDRAHS